MPTNPIPSGSCNLPVNMPRIARAAIGRLAFANDKFVGEFVRGLLTERLQVAGESGEISAELAFEAVEALNATGRKVKRAAVNVATASCLFLVCCLSALDGMARGNSRAARRPRPAAVRLARGSQRKIGEWEVTPV